MINVRHSGRLMCAVTPLYLKQYLSGLCFESWTDRLWRRVPACRQRQGKDIHYISRRRRYHRGISALR